MKLSYLHDPKHRNLLTLITYYIVAGLLFWQIGTFEFMNHDDPSMIFDRAFIRDFDVIKIITDSVGGLYHPLTTFTHSLDWQIGNGNPMVFHITNLLFHTANAFFVFLICQLLIPEAFAIAFINGLIFLIHPLKVESLCWITERKDLLATFFVFLSIISYIKYLNTEKKKKQYQAMLFYLCACLSKISVITLPAALLALEVYKKRNFKFSYLKEKFVFILVSVIPFIVNIKVQAKYGIEANPANLSFQKIWLQIYFYLEKLIFPLNLRPNYTIEFMKMNGYSWLALFLVLGGSYFILKYRKEERDFWFLGFALYSIFLLPYLKLIQYGDANFVFDRGVYIASIGFFIAFTPSIYKIFISFKDKNQRVLLFSCTGLLSTWMVCLAIISYKQSWTWSDSISLWTNVMREEPDNHTAKRLLGKVYVGSQQPEKAVNYLKGNVESPTDVFTLAEAYRLLGRFKDGIEILQRYSVVGSGEPTIIGGLAVLYSLDQQNEMAEEYFSRALRLITKDTDIALASFIHGGYAKHLYAKGELTAAEPYFVKSMQYNKLDGGLHYFYGKLLFDTGRIKEAEAEMKIAVEITKKTWEPYFELGRIFFAQKRYSDSLENFRYAIYVKQAHIPEAQEKIEYIEKNNLKNP